MNNSNVIQNVEEYIDLIFKLNRKRPARSIYDFNKYFFRGQNDAKYDLVPSLGRKIGKSFNTYLNSESRMIQAARLQYPEEFENNMLPVNILTKLQHYGMPTRLLDITQNALVALYFACKGQYDYDGAVFTFDKEDEIVHSAYSMHVNLIACQNRISQYTVHSLKDYWEDIKYEDFVPKNRDDDYDNVKEYLVNVLSEPMFFLPEMITEREKRQHAAFVIYPNVLDNDFLKDKLQLGLKIYSDKIIIASKRKRKILKQLELLGISEPFLFPEIDKHCNSVKEQVDFLFEDKM